MPLHDWTINEAGTFHNFHLSWISTLKDALNAGLMPANYFAMAEQRFGPREGDVLAFRLNDDEGANGFGSDAPSDGGTAVLTLPKVETSFSLDADHYARKTNRIVIRKGRGRVVAVIEIVSPGNKHSKAEIERFIAKCSDCFDSGIHLMVIDLFPPSPRDPKGLHNLIWEGVDSYNYIPPAGRDRTVFSYDSEVQTAYLESFAVGMPLPTMPLFLRSPLYVNVPLEETYQATWGTLPAALQRMILAGEM